MGHFNPDYAALAAPRYTSYPPATRFSPAVGEAEWRSWLAATPADAPVSVYVHIPFCRVLCWYCGCNTSVPNKDARVAEYLAALRKEIALVRAALGRKARLSRLHFGGGSPDMLSPARLTALMGWLKDAFDFSHADEIAVELDPRGVTEDLAQTLGRLGVTRASLGVQDVSAEVQALINREQPFELVEEAARRLRRAGVKTLNIDLMYGLPGQSAEHVRLSASRAASLAPDRLAVFGYAHVPWFKKHQRAIDETRLPDTAARFAQAEAAAEVLLRAGYRRIGMDHYARPDDPLARAARNGTLRRNFQGYTDDESRILIGLGASAISDAPQGFVQNEPNAAVYARLVGEGRLPVARGVARSEDDRLRGALIERLMCDYRADLPPPVQGEAEDRLQPYLRDGLARMEGRRLQVTEAGRPYVRLIAAALDAYQTAAATAHSRVV
ncbi:MAG: oxygen-independent coproporphyrinogen III oxidase [Maricaulaceae bacterium]|nr:oxygen-independent coproporphyrinogen III oxidase [Maricaulaceae bacterium]